MAAIPGPHMWAKMTSRLADPGVTYALYLRKVVRIPNGITIRKKVRNSLFVSFFTPGLLFSFVWKANCGYVCITPGVIGRTSFNVSP